MTFLWIKAFHIVAVIAWFAAIFYLPRLFVYHTLSEDEVSRERFKIMERKLLRAIANPARSVVFILGAWMSYLNWDYYSHAKWYWCKLALVALVSIYHDMCAYYGKQLREDRCTKSDKFFRIFNEIPVFLLVGIVIMVVVRPF
ncbi:membrane protein [Cellvibrio zantedeschiae]|uniref:Protoporphyrinogen IX oxidase n=1 Tax=Cellvibrio zantedeschiae TaxID=1237077 RepID=A0ABQ3B637_9GAMM|nr:protoporphyrinogen oxidase HemJ [Cellvibrio zantedeschiae]GGY81145.1 membrane protein [Cellvibrio zantedeschiae]